MKTRNSVRRPAGLNTHTHTCITKKGGYRCSFLERWCQSLDLARDWLC